jgi:hypothetical protein
VHQHVSVRRATTRTSCSPGNLFSILAMDGLRLRLPFWFSTASRRLYLARAAAHLLQRPEHKLLDISVSSRRSPRTPGCAARP